MTRGSAVNLGEAATEWRTTKNKEVNLFLSRKPNTRNLEHRPPVGYSTKKEEACILDWNIFILDELDANQQFKNTFDVFDESSRDIWHVYTWITHEVTRCSEEELFFGCSMEMEEIFFLFFFLVPLSLGNFALVNSLYLLAVISFWWQYQLIKT